MNQVNANKSWLYFHCTIRLIEQGHCVLSRYDVDHDNGLSFGYDCVDA